MCDIKKIKSFLANSTELRKYQISEINKNNFSQKEEVVQVLLSTPAFYQGCEKGYQQLKKLINDFGNQDTKKIALIFYSQVENNA